MSKYYYATGEGTHEGPFTRNDIFRFLEDNIIHPTTMVIESKETEWKQASEHPKFSELASELLIEIDSTGAGAKEGDLPQTDQQAKTKKDIPRLLLNIREKLNKLWECQREAIMSRITDSDLDEDLETFRENSSKLFREIETLVIDCWRANGKLLGLINENLAPHGEYIHELAVNSDRRMRMDRLLSWLDTAGLKNLKGCYCWKNGDSYLYVGQTIDLSARLASHKAHYMVDQATHVRILIPNLKRCKGSRQHKRRLDVLERLLILQYRPTVNDDKNGHKGNNQIDDCLSYIMNEIKELATDAN